MKIINQSHEILHITPNLLHQIETAGRTCYKSEDKIGCTVSGIASGMGTEHSPCYWYISINPCNIDQCYYHSSQKFTKMLIKKGHEAMLEFGDITVKFITNRGVSHELVRHRIGVSYAQESQRYVRYNENIEFILPVWFEMLDSDEDYEDYNIWASAMQFSENTYKKIIATGWRPEQARDVLPNATKTEIVMKANAREVRHIINLRCSKQAHPQMRGLMMPLLKELHEKVPVLFDDLYNFYFKEKNND